MCLAAFMPGPRNLHSDRDVSSYYFGHIEEKVVSSNSNSNCSKRIVRSLC